MLSFSKPKPENAGSRIPDQNMTHSCSNYVSRHELELRLQLVVATQSLFQPVSLGNECIGSKGMWAVSPRSSNIGTPLWPRLGGAPL